MRHPRFAAAVLLLALLFFPACAFNSFKLFTDPSDPLREFVLKGKFSSQGKVLVVSIEGVISGKPGKGMLRKSPSLVEEVVAQLDKAKKDKAVKAVVLKVNSPGGTATASDILYNEIAKYKKETKAKVVASFMDIAASGAYYLSLPANHIVAHPTTLTGSVGVIFLTPDLVGLMDKIGVDARVAKSGANKDMGSPFRVPGPGEEEMIQGLVNGLADRFISLVDAHRPVEDAAMETIKSARIFLAEEALNLGLVDQIGYLDDALAKARELAGLPEDAQVVVYRRTKYENDNLYRTPDAGGPEAPALVDLGAVNPFSSLEPGFQYLWAPGAR
jgi:protease-4